MNLKQTSNKTSNKNNKASVKAPKPLSEAQLFFKNTVAQAIEVLDLPYVLVMKVIQENSVSKLARILSIFNTIGRDNVQVILSTKRPVDHVKNFFSPGQINNLHGVKAILDAVRLYSDLVLRKEVFEAEIANKLAEQAKQEAAAAIPDKIAS
ncbi:MAG: hypothetical protein NTY12_04245 [Candidatus Falkowbacteria bacterium]|nr:hypothetical protein [Candidatus Falkowbacteria bacterium]